MQSHRIVFALVCLGGLAASAGEPSSPPENPIKGEIRHAFLLSDSGRGKVLRYSAEGRLVWECDAPNSYDACPLPNGNVLFTCRIKGADHGVREVTPERKVVWQFTDTVTTRNVTSFAILSGE